ncbi:PH domain-containing protein [Streptomyces yaizuensis]|uniref:PH domain-containing protein n=1 Tax=Streptomyces yaizuensis TaxID=2989713 RepID=A0ABQ5NVM6_9ACTN|nr:PH domain-containing protein [Streptomyces sp. YSPA8]GLF94265.1 PH domain-containing protein [Streptomyces sp. YSPA8]
MSSSQSPVEPSYADRAFRSPAGLVGGVLLLGLGLWLGVDAIVRGRGDTPWLAIAWLMFLVPLVVAFTLRPVVLANEDRLRIRNPFRTIDVPWSQVDEFRAEYSTELLTDDGKKYALWAVPVSLRQRKKATRQEMKAARTAGTGVEPVGEIKRAQVDQTIRELRLLCENNEGRPGAKGAVAIRWAYEIIAPAVVGGALLLALFVAA